MIIGYMAVRPFGPDLGEAWKRYIEWSGTSHLTGLVTLDGVLCPNVVRELTREDWDWNLPEEGMLFGFRSLEYLRRRVQGETECRILAVIRNPEPPDRVDDPRFAFAGFDLVESGGEISALTNCGGFPEAFRTDDLNDHGLISHYRRAVEVRDLLYAHYPDESHARCDLWAIWRLTDEEGETVP